METMNMSTSVVNTSVTQDEALGALHALAIILLHDEVDKSDKPLTLREIADHDTHYGQQKGSLCYELLLSCGAYAATAYRRVLDRKYGKEGHDEYMKHVQAVYVHLKQDCVTTQS